MASTPWNLSKLPTTPSPDQLYVDDKKQVWQYHAGYMAWQRRQHMYLTEVDRVVFNTYTRGVPCDPAGTATKYPLNQWDILYAQSFVEIEYPAGVTSARYESGITQAELFTIIRDNTPSNLGVYTDNAVAHVYQVIDPELQVRKQSHHNYLYSTFRGSEAYNRRYGRVKRGIPRTSGYLDVCDTGGGYWNDGHFPASTFFQDFYGIVLPDGDGKEAVWHNVKGDPYRHPKEGSILLSGFQADGIREAYDPNTQTFVPIMNPDTKFVIGEPKAFMVYFNDPTTRSIMPMNDLKGGRYFKYPKSVVLVYPLRSLDGLLAFYLKPYGVDTYGIGVNAVDGTMRVVAETLSGRGIVYRRLITATDAYDPQDQLTRYNNTCFGFSSIAQSRRVDTYQMPDLIQFYLLDTATGLRSEVLPQKYRCVRNKCHVTMALEPTT